MPRVTLVRCGVLTALRAATPPLLMIVPPVIVPLKLLRPPVPNTPLLPMSRVCRLLLKVPVMLIRPPVRVKLPKVGVAMLPPRFSVPAETLKLPLLVPLVPVRLKIPPLAWIRPLALLTQVALPVLVRVSVPALAPRVPLLVNEEPVPLSWMVVVPLAVLAKMPSLMTVAAL